MCPIIKGSALGSDHHQIQSKKTGNPCFDIKFPSVKVSATNQRFKESLGGPNKASVGTKYKWEITGVHYWLVETND